MLIARVSRACLICFPRHISRRKVEKTSVRRGASALLKSLDGASLKGGLTMIRVAIAALLVAGTMSSALAVEPQPLSGFSAQKRGCPANYEKTCMSRCMNSGGQPRKCPQYCAKRLRENCAG
jgi:hypothetical protein